MPSALFALVVALVVALLWVAARRKSAWGWYRASGGTADTAYRRAVRRAARRDDARHQALAAQAIERVELNLAAFPPLDRRVVVRRHYARALELIRAGRGGGATDTRAAAGDDTGAPPLGDAFIADAATEFAVAEIATADLDGRVGGARLFTEAVATRGEIIKARRAVAAGASKLDAAAAYVALAVQHTNDPQNVHDSGVLASQRRTLARLAANGEPTAAAVATTLAEVAAVVATHPDASKRMAAIRTLDAIRRGERVHALGRTDGECLALVWRRAADPRNRAVAGAIRAAVVDALADAVERGYVVCVNGRAARILGALVLLDHDPHTWEASTHEEIKNAAFETARKTIETVARRELESSEPARRKAAAAFVASTPDELAAAGPTDAADRLAAEVLSDDMRTAVAVAVRGGLPAGYPPALADAIVREAQGAVA